MFEWDFSIPDVTFLLRRGEQSVGGQSSPDNSRVARFPPEFSQNLATHPRLGLWKVKVKYSKNLDIRK